MKTVNNILKVGFYFVLCYVMLFFLLIKYIIKGERDAVRLVLASLVIGLLWTAFAMPGVFSFFMLLFAVVALLFSVYIVKSNRSFAGIELLNVVPDKGQHNERSESYSGFGSSRGESSNKAEQNSKAAATANPSSLFDGLSLKEAQKIYRQMMKQYHPDNTGGDDSMSKDISAAYDRYKSNYK